jgi:hypothetical protein
MSNGFGAFFGGIFSEDNYFTHDGLGTGITFGFRLQGMPIIAIAFAVCLNTNIMQRMLLL